jgi:hypothetical protein
MVPAFAAVVVAVPGACSSTSTLDRDGAGGSGASDDTPVTTVLHPDAAPLFNEAACQVVRTTGLAQQSTKHVTTCEPVTYSTNPPSSGDHWPVWATYTEHTTAVPREVYVHDLEHGAVVLAYRCEEGCDDCERDCDDVVEALRRVLDRAAADPLCASQPATRARVLITPDPELDTPIAAAGWRATYMATCIDEGSLDAFVADAYGRGPEATCSPGAIGDPATIACGQGGGGGMGGGMGGGGGG